MLMGLGGVVGRLLVLQVRSSEELARLGLAQRSRTFVLPAARGSILDRDGVPLALTVEARDVVADQTLVTDPVGEAALLAPVLGLDAREVREALEGDSSFAFVARQVDPALAERIESMALPGIVTLEASARVYPGNQLAAQVVGFVDVDGTGIAGLEKQYDELLAGTPGERTIEVGANGQPIANGLEVVTPPVPGADVVTTIDVQLQHVAEMAVRDAVEENGARSGSIVMMDPRTGEILAMATYPSFDPNRFHEFDLERFRNRALTDAFEPGSVNKVITAAAAVEEGLVPLDMRFVVPDRMALGGYTIHDSHPHPTERMTIGDIIAESSNIGSVKVAQRVGEQRLAEYLARFGFGTTTGTGFPGERAGDVPAVWEWTDASLATIAYGQGVTVTPIQMASVYATIANAGVWRQPRLVRGTVGPDGTFEPATPPLARRVISSDTARAVTEMLAYVVEGGTGLAAQIRGYQVAGKTGTALKVDPKTGRYTERYVASFIGFLPASSPRVVVAAILDEPRTIYGGVAAAPLFQKVARTAIELLRIPPAPPVDLPPHLLNADPR
jgi:cell division protein FtsI (penicillin-binding protein 3)